MHRNRSRARARTSPSRARMASHEVRAPSPPLPALERDGSLLQCVLVVPERARVRGHLARRYLVPSSGGGAGAALDQPQAVPGRKTLEGPSPPIGGSPSE